MIYVDRPVAYIVSTGKPPVFCHMYADEDSEMELVAERLGLPSEPHSLHGLRYYILTTEKRIAALRLMDGKGIQLVFDDSKQINLRRIVGIDDLTVDIFADQFTTKADA